LDRAGKVFPPFRPFFALKFNLAPSERDHQRARSKNGVKLAAVNKAEANSFAEKQRPLIEDIRKVGIKAVRGLCEELNGRGIPAARGSLWSMFHLFTVQVQMLSPLSPALVLGLLFATLRIRALGVRKVWLGL